MARRPCVAVIGAEPEAVRALASCLMSRGFDSVALAGPWAAEAQVARRCPDLMVLDLSAGGGSGTDMLSRLTNLGIPVLAITRDGDALARVMLLELGAADTMQGPADERELVARADALLARTGQFRRRLLRFETATADLTASQVLHDDGRRQPLSPGEVALLILLADAQGKVLTPEDIATAAPAADRDADSRAVGPRIARLRRKLETGRIEQLRGHGYRLRMG